jgi:uncharacterized membrane protein YkvA (DUF1232 family)
MSDGDRPTTGTGRELVPGVVVTDEGIGFGRTGGPGARPRQPGTMQELGRFLGDTGRLLWRLSRDHRVPWYAKAVAGGALVYVLSPLDVIPDVIPGVGRLDDLYLLVRALRYLAGHAGYDLLHELWPGSDDGFGLLLVLAGIRR